MVTSLCWSVARPAGFQNVDSLVPSSAPAACPNAAALAPTGTSRNAAPPASDPAGCCPWARDAGTSRDKASATLEARRLIDQHDRNVVLDGVNQSAVMAHQLFFRLGPML